jgi:hypothetical protein
MSYKIPTQKEKIGKFTRKIDIYKYPYMQRGTLIKISGTYPEMYKKYKIKNAPTDYDHNTWGVILSVKPIKRVGTSDPYYPKKLAVMEVKQEDGKILNVLTDAVKWNVGTIDKDLLGLGKQRHKSEVVPFIKKALGE